MPAHSDWGRGILVEAGDGVCATCVVWCVAVGPGL